jgi:hypothetical protein
VSNPTGQLEMGGAFQWILDRYLGFEARELCAATSIDICEVPVRSCDTPVIKD